ncbi:hypothetical protein MKX07_007740 [Trichoderma sp. CBMAI-0711]|nr:hypothetical protein MKX07_007740 [Trichoderma sp. CBMAI-0711]
MRDAQDVAPHRSSFVFNSPSEDGDPPFPGDLPAKSSLSLSSRRGDTECAELLLEEPDADLNAVNGDGNTRLIQAARDGDLGIVKMLLRDENKTTAEDDQRAFLAAADGGHVDVLEWLLATFHIDMNATDAMGSTALHLAASKGYITAVRLLLKTGGVDINKKDRSDYTALGRALTTRNQNVVEVLLPRKDLEWDENLENSIQEAAHNGHDDLLDSLLACDKYGITPLWWAMRKNEEEVVKILMPVDTTTLYSLIMADGLGWIEFMLRFGLEVDQRYQHGQTALHIAAEWGHWDIAKALLSAGADINAEDSSEMTPLRTALYNGEAGVARELLRRRASTTGIMSKEWHQVSEEPDGELAVLSEAFDGERHLDFLEAIDDCWSLFKEYPQRKNFLISVWTKVPFKLSEKEDLSANDLRIDQASGDMKPAVSIALWLPLDQFSSDRLSEHHAAQRVDQLTSRGKSPEMMDNLAKDAQKLADLRLSLASQISRARVFLDHPQMTQYGSYDTRKAVLKMLAEDFETGIKAKLDELDQMARDLLQIEFAWSSIREARTATKLGQNVMLLTYVSIFYLPLGFCAVSI